MAFTLAEINRYDRQMLLAGWGAEGQEKLRTATVTLQGQGIAAELCARYLAAAGIGTLRLEAFADEARALNPFVQVHQLDPIDSTEPATAHIEAPGIDARLAAAEDRAAVGCALAVETIKAILGAPFTACVMLAA